MTNSTLKKCRVFCEDDISLKLIIMSPLICWFFISWKNNTHIPVCRGEGRVE